MSKPEISFDLDFSSLSDLSREKKKDLLAAFRKMRTSIAWTRLVELSKVQVNLRVSHLITAEPANILEDGVKDAYLKGECNGLLTSTKLVDILIDSLESELKSGAEDGN